MVWYILSYYFPFFSFWNTVYSQIFHNVQHHKLAIGESKFKKIPNFLLLSINEETWVIHDVPSSLSYCRCLPAPESGTFAEKNKQLKYDSDKVHTKMYVLGKCWETPKIHMQKQQQLLSLFKIWSFRARAFLLHRTSNTIKQLKYDIDKGHTKMYVAVKWNWDSKNMHADRSKFLSLFKVWSFTVRGFLLQQTSARGPMAKSPLDIEHGHDYIKQVVMDQPSHGGRWEKAS